MTETPKPKFYDEIQELCLMDDVFFSACFDGNIPCVQYILRIILDKQDLIVTEAHTQDAIENIFGRAVRLDVLAQDSAGKFYNIEVQRTDKGAVPQRARYNSAMIDSHIFAKGKSFKDLPETFVIFITENDVLKGGEQIYFIERTILKSGELFGDGSHIVYVNGSIREGSPLGDLMHDFFCKSASEMKHKPLAECSEFFKGNKRGFSEMAGIMERLMAESREEGLAEGREEGLAEGREEGLAEGKITNALENIRALMESLHLTAEEAMNALKISPEKQTELAPLI